VKLTTEAKLTSDKERTLWRHIPELISLPKLLCNTYTQIKITKEKHSKLVIIKFALSGTLSNKCFQNHLTLKVEGKLVCHWRQLCRNCSYLVTGDSKYECFTKFCNICNKKQPSDHFSTWLHWSLASFRTRFVRFLRYGVHTSAREVWWVIWACTELHMCSKFHAVDDLGVDCE